MSADFVLFLIQNMGSPMVAGRNFPQSDIPIGIVYIGDSFATRFECFCRARAMSKGPATRGDFVGDIVDDARADAIFATLKTIVDDIVDDVVACGRALMADLTL